MTEQLEIVPVGWASVIGVIAMRRDRARTRRERRRLHRIVRDLCVIASAIDEANGTLAKPLPPDPRLDPRNVRG